MDNNNENNNRLPPSKTNSRASILSRKSSGRVTPDDHQGSLQYNSTLEIQTVGTNSNFGLDLDSSDDLSLASKFSGIEVNPLYDGGKRRKSSSAAKTFRNYLYTSNNSLDLSPRRKISNNSLDSSPKRQIRNFIAYPISGIRIFMNFLISLLTF